MLEKQKLELYKNQLTETTVLLEEAREAKSFMALEKLLKTKQALEEKIAELKHVLAQTEREHKASAADELDALYEMIANPKMPTQVVRQIKQACEARLGG